MREILFRGKTVCDGDWVYGGITWNPSRKKFFIHTDWEEAKVIPETVGQYTGLTDKNGRRVFEGDICWFYGGDYYSGLWEQNAIVAITDMTDDEQTHYLKNAEYCEVIGNIYDNPELTKEAEKI